MTIDEMIERLEYYRDTVGGDTEVRLMTQERWPFENSITGLCSAEEMHDACDEEPEDADTEAEKMVYIVEGGQLGYGSKRAWEAAY